MNPLARLKLFILAFLESRKAGMSIHEVMTAGVALFLLAIIMPIALLAIADANITGWGAPVVTIFQVLLPVVAVLGVALAFIPAVKGK